MASRAHRFLALATACLAGLAGCAEPRGAPGTNGPASWVATNVHVETYPTAQGLTDLARRVAEDPALGSRIRLDLQLGGVLGNEKETLEKLRFGAIQMACTSTAPLAEFAPAVGVLSLPFLFDDAEHLWRTLDGPIGERLTAELEAAGFVALAWYDAGARSFYTNRRAIRTVSDMRGLRIRVQRSEIMRDMVAALGAAPVALGFKEVYTALHTAAIDGAENNVPSYLSERHFEAAPFYSLDRHAMIPDIVLVATRAWAALGPEEQTALRQAARASAERQRELWANYRREAIARLREAGSTLTEVDEPASFRRAVAPVYEKHGGDYAELVAGIRAGSAMARSKSLTPIQE